MGAPNPAASDPVRAAKRNQNDMGDPLNSETRILQQNSARDSLSVNITEYAARTFDLEKGDELTVETHRDRIVVRPPTPDE